MKNNWLIVILMFLFNIISFSAITKIEESNGKWQLYSDNKPYYIKGITFGMKYDSRNIDKYMKELSELGCNTIRTWGTGEETEILLDSAQKYGIKVMLGLWLRHGRPGMEGDDSFDWLHDDAGKKAQWEDTLKFVKKYKNHPALLLWGVGNEVILNIATDKEKIVYSEYLEKLIKEIKRIDGNHVISSAGAWVVDAEYWAKYVPSLDLYGLNVYGGGASIIDNEVKKLGVNKPYILTEFGAKGEWEAPKDRNGLPTEPSDEDKFNTIANGWNDWLVSKNTCLGGFVFNYGDGWDHGSIWLSLLMKDYIRPMYWATKKAFTNDNKIENPIKILKYEIPDNGFYNEWIPVNIETEVDLKNLNIEMYYNQRTGSRTHKDAIFPLEIKKENGNKIYFKAPKIAGIIKVYIFLSDKDKNLGIAQKSIEIESKNSSDNLLKNELFKFIIYDDDPTLTDKKYSYIPSGIMGDKQFLNLDFGNRENPKNGDTALKVTFDATKGWVGCAWQSPADNWGNKQGGHNLSDYKKLTFWAKGLKGDEKVSFSYGIVDKGNISKDSSKGETGEVTLSQEWQKYSINVKKKNMDNIITGFCFFTGSSGKPVVFYLDDIQFE